MINKKKQSIRRRIPWQSIGPGIIWAAAAIGVSHLVQSTRAGADFGFVANAQIIGSKHETKVWVIPTQYHSPIKQGAVVLTGSKIKTLAVQYLQFLDSEPVKALIQADGYLTQAN